MAPKSKKGRATSGPKFVYPSKLVVNARVRPGWPTPPWAKDRVRAQRSRVGEGPRVTYPGPMPRPSHASSPRDTAPPGWQPKLELQDLTDARAIRDMAARDRVAYQRQLERDPDYKSVEGQRGPDWVYQRAAVIAARQGQDAATAYTIAELHKMDMARHERERRAWDARAVERDGTRLAAALHTLAKHGTIWGAAVLVCYEVSSGPYFAVLTSAATVWVIGNVVAAFCLRKLM